VSLTFSGGSIAVVVEKTVGTVHTTTVHIVPIWLILIVLAVAIVPIWITRKGPPNSN
jgi:hypothetical protein